MAHTRGHWGITKTVMAVGNKYWPGWRAEVSTYIHHCEVCLQRQKVNLKDCEHVPRVSHRQGEVLYMDLGSLSTGTSWPSWMGSPGRWRRCPCARQPERWPRQSYQVGSKVQGGFTPNKLFLGRENCPLTSSRGRTPRPDHGQAGVGGCHGPEGGAEQYDPSHDEEHGVLHQPGQDIRVC